MAALQTDFMAAVLARLGLTQTELGLRLQLPNAYAQVHNWCTGKKKLALEETLQLLDMCQWLNMGEDARESVEIPPDPQAVLAARVAELAGDVTKILETLGVAQPEAEQPAVVQKPRQAASRRKG